MITQFKNIDDFLSAYESGQRHFIGWDFEEDCSLEGRDLQGVQFEDCFLFLNFRNADLRGVSFLDCNIKTADFRGANLDNATIRNCLVESTMFKGASTENFTFDHNHYHSAIVGQEQFEKHFRDSDAWDDRSNNRT